MTMKELETTVAKLSAKGKGILAADESTGTITKRFEAVGIPSTEDTRRTYREMLLTTPHISDFIAGVILYEETLNQKTSNGMAFPELLKKHGIIPGIKVDKGLALIPNTKEEQFTQGLDGLAERLVDYKNKGALFAKWRAVYAVSQNTPSKLAMRINAEGLASYAALCQAAGIVPIVEPEVLIDSDHTLERCAEVTEEVLHAVFNALYKHKVTLEHIILKPSMVISGKKCAIQSNPEQVGKLTVAILKRTVPAAVPSINFLSGGQSCEQATANLQAMNTLGNLPWNLSFSYARALQDYPMKIWRGDNKNMGAAQEAFLKRAKLNSLASTGKYTTNMEKETITA